MRILVINGVNLNMLGIREKSIYGSGTLNDIEELLKAKAKELDIEIEFFQSNYEGEIVEKIHSSLNNIDGILINPGAFTHYSIAIRDALLAVNIPFVEVHISNIYKREEFRQKSFFSDIAIGVISGFGLYSYLLGLEGIVNYLNRNKEE